MPTSERVMYHALLRYNDPAFRERRQKECEETCPRWDARAATFEAMNEDGRFEDTYGQPMTDDERNELREISDAVIRLSNEGGIEL